MLTETTAPGQGDGTQAIGPEAAPGAAFHGARHATPPRDLTTASVLRRTMRDYLLPSWRLAAVALASSAIVAATTGVLPILIQQVFDKVLVEKNANMLVLISLATIAVSAFKGLATYTANVMKSLIGQRIISSIQTRMFARIMRADLAWISATHSGRFISSFMTDATRLRDTVTTSVIDFTQNLLNVIALMGAMFYMNWKLALLATAIIPLGALYMRKLGRRTRKAARQGMEGTGDLSANISEALGGIRVVKAYGQEEREISRVTKNINDVLHHTMKAARTKAAASPLTEALSGIGIAAVIYFGGMAVIDMHLTAGELMAFISAMMLAYQPLKAVANTQTIMQEGVAAAARVFPILDVEPHIVTAPDAKPLHITDGAIPLRERRLPLCRRHRGPQGCFHPPFPGGTRSRLSARQAAARARRSISCRASTTRRRGASPSTARTCARSRSSRSGRQVRSSPRSRSSSTTRCAPISPMGGPRQATPKSRRQHGTPPRMTSSRPCPAVTTHGSARPA